MRPDDSVRDHLVLGGVHVEHLKAEFGTDTRLLGVINFIGHRGDVLLTGPEIGSSEMRGLG